jgi:dUTP pyrophosphatase
MSFSTSTRCIHGVETPKYATQNSACFDLTAFLGPDIIYVDSYNRLLLHALRSISKLPERDGARGINLEPGESAIIPTGLIFDIPPGYKIAVYPRSGLSVKKHIKLSNCVAVIDEDYVHQTMILIFNDSQVRQSICHGDRLAQGELVPVVHALLEEVFDEFDQKTDRAGGMGHTGINSKIGENV